MSSRFVRLLAAPVGAAGALTASVVLAASAASAAYPAAIWRTARELPGIG